jgi:demethylmenaquinone methyltransferase/2-methoxy-6-polyprenyl-1,4-benzoquinol methylase
MRAVLPSAEEKPVYVNRMFARIARTYDFMNRLMSGGQDQRWRRLLLGFCNLPPRGRLLDVGTGTGDIAFGARRRFPGVEVVGVDFTYEMLAVGQAKAGHIGRASAAPLLQGDALALPFAADSFDAVVSGFLLRNLVDRKAALREQARVTKPGGRVVVLETTPPANTPLGPLFQFYFFRIVPLIGGLVSGDREAYRYLPQSTVDFPMPEALRRLMEQAGLTNVFYRELMFGSVAIHVGTKVGQW